MCQTRAPYSILQQQWPQLPAQSHRRTGGLPLSLAAKGSGRIGCSNEERYPTKNDLPMNPMNHFAMAFAFL